MSNSPPPTRAAFCEEFSEEAQKTLPETRQTASTANTAAKRSKPEVTRTKPLRDEFSDSGYSSHTAATLGSGDSSSLESRREAPLEQPTDATADSSATVKDGEKKSKSRSRSPKKTPLQRTGSQGKSGYETTRRRDCECSDCLEKKARRRTLPQVDTEIPVIATAKPKQKIPTSPMSPQFARPSPQYPPPEAVALHSVPQPARPRASTSQSSKQSRPVSFHAGAMPQVPYMQHPAFVDRPQMAGYTPAAHFPQTAYPTNQPSYFSPLQPLPPPQEFYAHVPNMTAPYEVQHRPRPIVSARPQTMYHDMPSPLMEYVQPIYQSSRSFDRPPERQPRRQQPHVPSREYIDQTEARHQMPPPPPPPPRGPSRTRQESRPVIRHATTSSAAYPVQRNVAREYEDEHNKSRPTSRKHSFEAPPLSRRPSMARPPRTSDEKVAQALQLERDMARMNIWERNPTSPQSKRRASVYGHESLKDLEGSVEAYQASKSGREYTSIPAGDEMMRLIRKKTLPTSGSSDAGSRMSGGSRASRDGSDIKSGQRSSNDLKKRDSNDEAFAMRIPKGANVNLQPASDGRSISMELRIGERGRDGNNGLVGSRPAIREKSRKRYSIVDGQALIEAEREPEFDTRQSISRRESMSRRADEGRIMEREIGDDGQRRIIRERVITRTTDRSRRGSRNRYGGVDQNMF